MIQFLTLRERKSSVPTKLKILAFFFFTQVLDILTTTVGMSTGLTREGNPIILALIEAFSFEGAMLIKLLVSLGLAMIILRFNLPHLVILGASLGLVVVLWNLITFARAIN